MVDGGTPKPIPTARLTPVQGKPLTEDMVPTAAQLPKTRARRLLRPVLLGLVPLLAVIGGGLLYWTGGRYVGTEDAYVKADLVMVSPDVAGTVQDVFVRDNQQVSAGEPLFRIDPASFQVEVDKAEARLAQVRLDFEALKASYREKQAEIALARTKSVFAEKELKRETDLGNRKFVSASNLDQARQASELASQQIQALEQDLTRIAATLGGGTDTPLDRYPDWLAAQAGLESARLDLARTLLRASLPGTVSNPPKKGQHLAVGSPAMALAVTGSPYVEANLTETDLTHVQPGQPVTVRVDSYPGTVWHGTVDSLSPVTGAELSVIPAQNATGNWVKIAQRLPVRIHLKLDSGLPQLRAGMSADVQIDTGHRRRIFGLAI